MAHNTYDQRNIQTMEAVWGRGYMSPGGDAEVERIVANVDLAGASILDFGCGAGGASIAIARLGLVERIVSLDVEPSVLQRAKTLADQTGVSEKIEWQLIEPGPLPFAAGTFDVVYANSVTCHIQDLRTLAKEVHRVLTPSGKFIGSEWYVGANQSAFETYDGLLRGRGLSFFFLPREIFAKEICAGGFDTVRFEDRTAAAAEIAVGGQRRITHELRADLESELGTDGFEAFYEWGRLRAEVLATKGMEHGHFFADR